MTHNQLTSRMKATENGGIQVYSLGDAQVAISRIGSRWFISVGQTMENNGDTVTDCALKNQRYFETFPNGDLTTGVAPFRKVQRKQQRQAGAEGGV